MARMKTKRIKEKILINVGCLFDIPTATFITGVKGETIVNGGLQSLTGLIGPPNVYKSALATYMSLSAINHIMPSYDTNVDVFDTEVNTDANRWNNLGKNFTELPQPVADEDSGVVDISDISLHSGDEWLILFRDRAKEQTQEKKVKYTAFKNKAGVIYEDVVPTVGLLDSLSKFESGTTMKMIEKNTKDDGSLATLHMKKGLFKANFLAELPRLCGASNVRFITTAHVGESIDMDSGPMAKFNKPVKKLQFMGDKDKIKGVPADFSTLMSIVWFIKRSSSLIHRESKLPEYPKNAEETLQKTDLNLLTIMPLRNKHGASGFELKVIVSQIEGIMPTLTEFHFLKENGRFGFVGGNTSYATVFLPDIKIGRTTIRTRIEENPKLRRAINLLSDMLQLSIFHPIFTNNGLMCTPEELYSDLIAIGYDWDVLLDTRGWWTIDQYGVDTNYLSIVDLLKMRRGLYTPYWYKGKIDLTKVIKK